MKNNFAQQMAKLADIELEKFLQQRNDCLPEAIEAVEHEIEKRKLIRENILKYTNQEIADIVRLGRSNSTYELESAITEAQKRNLYLDNDKGVNVTGQYHATPNLGMTNQNRQQSSSCVGTIGLILGVLSALVLLLAFLPFFGALNWLNIPFAIVGLIFCAVGGSRGGMVLCVVVILLGLIRLSIGGGLF